MYRERDEASSPVATLTSFVDQRLNRTPVAAARFEAGAVR
jgi:hypothetical protein